MSRRKRDSNQKETIEKLIKRVDQEASAFKSIITVDESILRLKLDLTRLLKNNRGISPILLTGETGNGKTELAKAIHTVSQRPGKFVNVNASVITDSLFESELFGHKKGAFTGANYDKPGIFRNADKGTLLLDEFGEISLNLQAKLLKTIEEGIIQPVGSSNSINVDVLLIICTNINFQKAIENNTFRKDLYYRINKYMFDIPPLRSRKNDILLLAEYFIEKFSKKPIGTTSSIKLSAKTKELLLNFSWPGNIRQLENLLEVLLNFRDQDELDDISPEEIIRRFPEICEEETNGNDTLSRGRHQKNAESHSPPVVSPAPGMRKMPSKEDIEKLLQYFFAQEGRPYGVKAKTAKHIGVAASNLSNEIKRLGIIFPAL